LRVVIDTNVFISAFLKPASKPSRILRLIIQGDLQIALNEQILREYSEVAARPRLLLDRQKVSIVLDYLRTTGINAPSVTFVPRLPDPANEPFLEAALATKADFLIPGNKKHYPARDCKGVIVVTPTEFLQKLASSAEG
jgi:putative PIN family toxin of toxin-antitoxin system